MRRQAASDSQQVLDRRIGRQHGHHPHLCHLHHHVLETLVALCSSDPSCACEEDACEGEKVDFFFPPLQRRRYVLPRLLFAAFGHFHLRKQRQVKPCDMIECPLYSCTPVIILSLFIYPLKHCCHPTFACSNRGFLSPLALKPQGQCSSVNLIRQRPVRSDRPCGDLCLS